MIYAAYRDIDAQINSILNRSPDGKFTWVGDISDSADQRYSDDLITEARRKAAYKIFEAIGSDPSHPYWGDLMALYAVNHNATIPVHYGEIGIPLIAPNDTEVETHATGSLTVNDLGRASGSLTVVDPVVAFATGYLTVTNPSGQSVGTLTLAQEVKAAGRYDVVDIPVASDTIVVNGVTFTFVDDHPTAVQIPIQATLPVQAASIADVLKEYALANPASPVAAADYDSLNVFVTITAAEPGVAGNSFTTVGSLRVIAEQANLGGGADGVQEDEVAYVNGIKCIFNNGTPTSNTIYVGLPDATVEENTVNLANALANSTLPALTIAEYSITADNEITITHIQSGAVGDLYALAESDLGHVTVSGATLVGGTGGVVEGDEVVLHGVTITFSNYTTGPGYSPYSITGNAAETAALLAAALTAIPSGNIFLATYTQTYPPIPGDPVETLRAVKIMYKTVGVAGNGYTLGTITGTGLVKSGNNLTGGFTTGLVVGSLLVVNGVTFSFIAGASSGTDIQIGGSFTASAQNIVDALNASAHVSINIATYSRQGAVVQIVHDSTGAGGNAFTINDSTGTNAGAIHASGAHLTGGELNVVDGEVLDVNGAVFSFSYTQVGDYYITPGSTPSLTAIAIANKLTDSSDGLVDVAGYTANSNVVTVRHIEQGTIGNSFTLTDGSEGSVTASGPTLTGGGVEIDAKFLAGTPADSDWIDNARTDLLGISSNYFGNGKVDHDGDLGDGIPSPLAGRYSTANSVFKFTGARARIPMIKVPPTDGTNVLIDSDLGSSTAQSSTIIDSSTTAAADHIGRLLILMNGLTELARGVVSGVTAGASFDISPYKAISSGSGTWSLYQVVPSAAQVMADTKIPLELAALNVKLALVMCVKEGDNNFRTIQWLGSEAERDLLLIKAGSVKVSPIDLVKLSQVGQKYTA